MIDKRRLQLEGEDLAANFLTDQGYRVVKRNWRTKFGELDAVAMDGSTLVFVEVKTRTTSAFAAPELAVGYRKQVQIRRLAEAYLSICRPEYDTCRFDVVAVDERGVRHIPGAF